MHGIPWPGGVVNAASPSRDAARRSTGSRTSRTARAALRPALLDHRGLPPLAGRQHVILAAEHLGPLQVVGDLEAHLPAKGVRPQLADRAERLVAARLADAEQIAEVRGLAVPVLALQGGGQALKEILPCRTKNALIRQALAAPATVLATSDGRTRDTETCA